MSTAPLGGGPDDGQPAPNGPRPKGARGRDISGSTAGRDQPPRTRRRCTGHPEPTPYAATWSGWAPLRADAERPYLIAVPEGRHGKVTFGRGVSPS
ncbi:hypothetical protein [Streptomyces sp. NPDC002845]